MKIKDENVEIINMRYDEEKEEYAIVFQILNLDKEERRKIIQQHREGSLNSQGANITEIVELNQLLFIEEIYDKKYMKGYKSLIPFAEKIELPERLDPEKLEIEDDLCSIEQDMGYRIKLVKMVNEV